MGLNEKCRNGAISRNDVCVSFRRTDLHIFGHVGYSAPPTNNHGRPVADEMVEWWRLQIAQQLIRFGALIRQCQSKEAPASPSPATVTAVPDS